MRGIIRILHKFAMATICISIFLLIFNYVLLGIMIFKEMNLDLSPKNVLKQVNEGLNKQDENYQLDEQAVKCLQNNRAWAMLIGENGQVQWEYQLPKDVPSSYKMADIAKFSRYYLSEYPVYTWEHQDGLLVVGYPKKSHWKYQLHFLSDSIQSMPMRLLLLLLFNIGITVFISMLIGTRLIRKIRPLVSGVHKLAKEEVVQLDSKGLFGDLAQSINSASTKLQNKTAALKMRDEARSNWIAGISHDIRTPLSIILGYASEMEDDSDLSEDQRERARIMRHQGEKLRALVSDLNLVSMLEYEMQPLYLKNIRLSVLARQVATDFLNNGLDDKYQIELKLKDDGAQIRGDEKLLIRAISNVVQNSIRHNPNGCEIIIETALSKDRSTYHFIVQDNGQGIPNEKIAEITELPYSSKRKQTIQEGHGLGIPMVARIMQAHQGQLILTNNENQKGLQVVMEFPLNSQNEKVYK